MKRRQLLVLALLGLGLAPKPTEAQGSPERVYRVGLLCLGAVEREIEHKEFVEELARLGFTQGKNLLLERRASPSSPSEELMRSAAELVALKVDVITTWCGTAGAQAAQRASATTPIVFSSSADPVATGLVASLARPGGNLTGLSNQTKDMFNKSQEYLVQAVPAVKRIAVLHHSSARALPWFKEFEVSLPATGKTLGIRTEFVGVSDIAELEPTLKRLIHEGVNGLMMVSSNLDPPAFFEQAHAAAQKNRIPFVGDTTHGALLRVYQGDTNGPLRVAQLTAKILRGARPADLPVEQPTVVKLSINLKTAQSLGLHLPKALLLRADEVIQ